MNKLKIAVLLIAAFTAGETIMSYRARHHYRPRVESLKTKNETLKGRLEVERLLRRAWQDAALELDRGYPAEEVKDNMRPKVEFIRVIKSSI